MNDLLHKLSQAVLDELDTCPVRDSYHHLSAAMNAKCSLVGYGQELWALCGMTWLHPDDLDDINTPRLLDRSRLVLAVRYVRIHGRSDVPDTVAFAVQPMQPPGNNSKPVQTHVGGVC